MVRPNFTDVRIQGAEVRVNGTSGVEPTSGSRADFGDVVDIRVVLIQGDRVEHGAVDAPDPNWSATFPVKDPAEAAPDYHAGEAVAVGVETRKENFTVISWRETMTIA
jgi:hypothetical protein